jgi:hypothetical protein
MHRAVTQHLVKLIQEDASNLVFRSASAPDGVGVRCSAMLADVGDCAL